MTITDTTLAKSIASFDARPEAQWPIAEINRWLETAQAENVILLAQQVLDLAAEVERLTAKFKEIVTVASYEQTDAVGDLWNTIDRCCEIADDQVKS